MLELWLVRHAESIGNVRGDQADTDLSPLGQEQAGALAARLPRTPFDAIFSSNHRRCISTAQLALPGAPLRIDPRLREFETGPEPRFVDPASMTREQLPAGRYLAEDRELAHRAAPDGRLELFRRRASTHTG